MAKADAPPMFMDSKDLELVRKMYPVSDAVAKRSLGPTEWSKLPVSGGKFPQVTHKRLRQSSKPLLNKLEERWLVILKATFPTEEFLSQAIRFKLGNGIWYKPDFFCFSHDWPEENALSLKRRPTAWEVKGPKSWRGGFENLKVAAGLYPNIRWVLVWDDFGWNEQQVLP